MALPCLVFGARCDVIGPPLHVVGGAILEPLRAAGGDSERLGSYGDSMDSRCAAERSGRLADNRDNFCLRRRPLPRV